MIDSQPDIGDGMSSTPRFAELTDQLTEPKELYLSHPKVDGTGVAWLKRVVSQ